MKSAQLNKANKEHEMANYDSLKLDNQLCFPLYACAKEIVRQYKPYLDDLDLTYTQYVTMMVLWEENHLSVKALGKRLYLDSGTLTPLLKKLEAKGYLTRTRSEADECSVIISLTDEGLALRDKALAVPEQMRGCVRLSKEDAQTLYRILYQLLGGMTE